MSDFHLLVVDDDDRIRELLRRYLVKAGYRVTTASDAASARRLMVTLSFDLAILDIMMPGEDGLSLLSAIRSVTDLPVLLLTARGMAEDRIEGLQRGADDYLAKPFDPQELELRVCAILRRAGQGDPPQETLRLSGLEFNPDSGQLMAGDGQVHLTESEVLLLSRLARTPGEAVSREELARATSAGLERAIDVQVTRLRRKIERDPRQPVHLQTVRGIGYRLVAG